METPINLSLESGKKYSNYEIIFSSNSSLHSSMEEMNSILIYSDKNEVHIKRSNEEKAQISITNLLGQSIMEIETSQKEIVLPLEYRLSNWIAIVKVIENKQSKTTKLLMN